MATYKVVPFMGKLKFGGSASEVSGQLQSLINAEASQGWMLDSIHAVNIEVKAGCLGGLIASLFGGSKDGYAQYDQVIFRRD